MSCSKIMTLAVVSCLAAFPAMADKPDHGDQHKSEHSEKMHGSKAKSNFDGSERAVIQSYLKDHYGRNYGRNCPPGLAKKNNGCLPPGQAKKYGIGGPLPRGYKNLPRVLANRLGAPPPGMRYAMVDNDVLLVSSQDQMILDAVTLLSALGR